MKCGLLAALLICGSIALAQDGAEIAAAPHYQNVLENDQVRVYAMMLHPDEFALVRLHHSFLTVALQDGEIIIWDDGKSPIQHFQVHKGETSFRCLSTVCMSPQQVEKGIAGGFRNDRPGDYRNITVEFLDPKIGWSMTEGGLLDSPGVMFLGGALVANVLLRPGDSIPFPNTPGAMLLIPVTDVDLRSTAGIRIRKSMGDVAWLPAASSLINAGREPASFIAVQFRPGDYAAAPVTH